MAEERLPHHPATRTTHGVEPLDDEDWPNRELRLGFDTQARLLETVVLVFENGDEMVIPAGCDRS